MQTGLAGKAGLVIGALEDDEDNDDDTSGIRGWVLSFRDKPKLNSLVFKPAATKSAPLRALTGARAKTGAGEEATDADATAFCTTIASFRNTKKSALPFAREVVVDVVVATARRTPVATTTEFKTIKLTIDL